MISLSVTNASNQATFDLTQGTKVNVSVTSPRTEISNLIIKIGNATIYNNSEKGNTLNKSISADSFYNQSQLVAFSTYKVEAIVTNKNGKQSNAIKENIRSYIIKSYEDLVTFSNVVNAGDNLSGKTVYLSQDLDLRGKNQLIPIGYRDNKPFSRNFQWR